jgi:hypothetical protein
VSLNSNPNTVPKKGKGGIHCFLQLKNQDELQAWLDPPWPERRGKFYGEKAILIQCGFANEAIQNQSSPLGSALLFGGDTSFLGRVSVLIVAK